MTEDLEQTVEEFLERVDAAYEEYEQGYTDADATLRVVKGHVDHLRDEVE